MTGSAQHTERVHTIVIGGGQAGLSTGYHLRKLGVPFLILDAHERIGDAWRTRWDSLRLFSTAAFNGLDGLRFPGPGHALPTKDEMADYLESYARHFALPVRTGTKVDSVYREGEAYVVTAGEQRFEAENVVVAMANYQKPRMPAFAHGLDPSILQIHSRDYRDPRQLRDGGVLVVGAGNSGAEIACELSRAGRPVWLSGRDVGEIPWRGDGLAARLILTRILFRLVFHRLLTVDTRAGRMVRAKGHAATPLIRVKTRDLRKLGVARVAKVSAVHDGKPMLEDGRLLDVPNVIWCTGFESMFPWIDLPIVDSTGEPRHERGVVPGEPGFYFVGLHFLSAMSSAMIHGVGRDAAYVARVIAERSRGVSRCSEGPAQHRLVSSR